VQTGDDPPAYVRELDHMSLVELLVTVRTAGEDDFLNPDALPVPPPIADVAARIEAGVAGALKGTMVRDLVTTPTDPQDPPPLRK
jgi:hypothetical protein